MHHPAPRCRIPARGFAARSFPRAHRPLARGALTTRRRPSALLPRVASFLAMSDAAPPSTGASAAASESSAPVVVTLEARDDDAGAVAALEAELAAEREVSMRLRADKLVLETNLRDAAKAHADELALVRARSAKSEEALQGALKMARAMSAAQRAKIDQSWQTQEALETEAGDLHAALEDARGERAKADAEAASLAEKLEAAERRARRALVLHAAAKLEWAAERAAIRRSHLEAADADEAAAARTAALARDALEGRPPDPRDYAAAGPAASASRGKAAREDPPGVALRALFAATTPSRSRAALRDARRRKNANVTDRTTPGWTVEGGGAGEGGGGDGSDATLDALLMDAMEDEIAASVARGYAFDDEDGSVIVGAGAIVQSIIAKYDVSADEVTEAEGEEAGGKGGEGGGEIGGGEGLVSKSSPAGRGNHPAPLFSEDAAGPAVAPSRHPVDVEAARSRSRRASLEERREREGANAAAAEDDAPARWRHERAALVAELQEARQAAEATRVLAASSPPRDEPDEEDSDSASLDAEEALAIARLDLESRRRCAELEAALADARRRAASAGQLERAMAQVAELRARLDAIRDAAVMQRRLVEPTVRAALACLDRGGGISGGIPPADSASAVPPPSPPRFSSDAGGALGASASASPLAKGAAVVVAEAEAAAASRALADARGRAAEAAEAARRGKGDAATTTPQSGRGAAEWW
jgi:hypothetical protein